MNNRDQLTAAIAESLRMPEPPSGAGLLHGNLSRAIIGAAIEVHKHLGPGQLECTYQHALERELASAASSIRRRWPSSRSTRAPRSARSWSI